jgi:hypothetical protein
MLTERVDHTNIYEKFEKIHHSPKSFEQIVTKSNIDHAIWVEIVGW